MTCDYCKEEILPGERADNHGSDFHRECLFRLVGGSWGHILKECSCYGGTMDDPPGMSKRQGAVMALALYRDLHPPQEEAV